MHVSTYILMLTYLNMLLHPLEDQIIPEHAPAPIERSNVILRKYAKGPYECSENIMLANIKYSL